jgi:O-antigen/teichoic acid export membrane protein
VIRATAVSLVDQGLLSAVNFALGLTLIRFATAEEYGLYTQLTGLQSLFSVVHAGLFVSAFLAVLPRKSGAARAEYRAGMARAELVVTFVSMLLVAALTWVVAAWFEHPVSMLVSMAAACALLSLWWREFVRAGHFAELAPLRVLWVDTGFAVLVVAGMIGLVSAQAVSAANVLWCIGIAGVAVTLVPILRKSRESRVDAHSVRTNVAASWQAARWEVLTSLVAWSHAQTFVYFAAAQGGLRGAAQISAARLLTMPLALVWASYANILRPSASRLLEGADSRHGLMRLARNSALFVIGLAAVYALVLTLALPLLEQLLFAGKIVDLHGLTSLWLVYFTLTGMTTIAASVLRSALRFKMIFAIQALCAACAVLASFAGLAFATPAVFIVVLIAVELLLASLLWRQLHDRLREFAPAAIALPAARQG